MLLQIGPLGLLIILGIIVLPKCAAFKTSSVAVTIKHIEKTFALVLWYFLALKHYTDI